MIIKIDHIAFSSRDIDEDARILEEKGYKVIFKEKATPNIKIKKNLLRGFNKFHDICLLESKSSTPIEIINHHNINEQQGYILPIIKNINKKDETSYFNTAIIKTTSFNRSIEFWKLLGFKEIKKENGISVLEFRSIINKTNFTIEIKDNRNYNKKPLLDDKGFTCIAFVSNSAQKERELLISKGVKTTEIEESIINGKLLNIFFAIGPSGELVEVLSPKKSK